MTLKLKSLLEQPTTAAPESADTKPLVEMLQIQRALFKNMLQQLEQQDYIGIDAETQEYVVNNPVTLCEAYIAYCDATLNTIRTYASQNYSQAELAAEEASTFYTRVKTGLTY